MTFVKGVHHFDNYYQTTINDSLMLSIIFSGMSHLGRVRNFVDNFYAIQFEDLYLLFIGIMDGLHTQQFSSSRREFNDNE